MCREIVRQETLSAGELLKLQTLEHPSRRQEWLRGRGAIKILLRAQGLSEDTSLIRFPHPAFSLTHSGGIAIAVSALAPAAQEGIGIDFEIHRPMRLETARFFLSEEERAALQSATKEIPETLLRLWTVKEALFKADPENEGRRLSSYRLSDPLQETGEAMIPAEKGKAQRAFRYLSLELTEGFFSLTVNFQQNRLPK